MSELMNLDIILRICGKHGVITGSVPRICGTDRKQMLLKCFASLIQTVNASNNPNINYHLYILDDHSEQSFINQLNQMLTYCNKPFTFVNLQDHGHNHSSFEQFRYGRDVCKGLVYFVEDDYLHTVDAIDSMLDAYFYFRGMSDLNEVAIYPYDSTHNYEMFQVPQPTRLFYDGKRYWRSTSKTACTMFVHNSVVKAYFPLFEKMALEYQLNGPINEDNTINRIFNNTTTMGGPVWLFSPIPSVAIHISFVEPNKIVTDLCDWRQLYDETDYQQYLQLQL